MQSREFPALSLSEDVTREDLDRLLSNRELMSSPSGRIAHVARVRRQPRGLWRIRHGSFDVRGEYRAVRLLNVSASRVAFWAEDKNGRAGTWVASRSRVRFKRKLREMKGMRPSSLGNIPYGRNPGDPESVLTFVLPHGVVRVEQSAHVLVFQDGTMVSYDRAHRQCIRWDVGLHGLSAPRSIALPPGDFDDLKVIRWHANMIGFAVRRGNASSLWVSGRETYLQDGIVEQVWNSPADRTFALLVRTGVGDHLIGHPRVLFTVRGDEFVPVVRGHFEMGQRDVVWSQNGKELCASVIEFTRDRDGTLRKTRRIVPSAGDEIAASMEGPSDRLRLVAGFQVDNDGAVAIYVIDDGACSRVVIPGVDEIEVPLAWNLNIHGPDVIFNAFADGKCAKHARTRSAA